MQEKRRKLVDKPFYFVDLFCGAGGTTTGLHNALIDNKQVAEVFACVNHDEKAIKSHYMNHPETTHYTEDIRKLNVSPLIRQVKKIRAMVPDAIIAMWASLECTHFSKAKGGSARDADSRSLADEMDRYVENLNPVYFFVENVEEFMLWGPLDENGQPIKDMMGTYYKEWVKRICSYGYNFEYRILNSADYGAHTSRKRFFGIFAKEGMPICFPDATYTKNPEMKSKMKKWRPVRELLDFADEGKSIFFRKKPLVNKTMTRILSGLIKYVAGGMEAYEKIFDEGRSLKKHATIAEVENLLPKDIERRKMPDYWLDKQYSGHENHASIDGPAGTIMINDKHVLMRAEHFIYRQFTGGGQLQSVDETAGSILTVPKMNLVSTKKWLMNTNFNNVGTSVDDVSPTLLASRHHYYLMNPQWGGHNASVDRPCPTIIARQDKAPLYLVSTNSDKVVIGIYDDDPEPVRKIKEFMVLYSIVDIKMRMLKVPELLKIQGFPVDYKLFGNQTDQKKFIGNSVTPIVPEEWIIALHKKICA